MHLDETRGRSVETIRADGLTVDREIPFLNAAAGVADETAGAMSGVASAIRSAKPDALLLLGDRTETLAAAAASVIEGVPVIHLHGGEESEGVIDNLCRHAITKLSHLHLVSHETHARRVRQMGEDPSAVVVVGAPGLDNLYRDDLPGDAEIEKFFSGNVDKPILLVTMHPVGGAERSLSDAAELAKGLEQQDALIVVTSPNVDEGGSAVRAFWEKWSKGRSNVRFIPSLGERLYWGLLSRATAAVGNSSSGLIEAPAAGASVVNIGTRQAGRVRYGSVVDLSASAAAVHDALRQILRSPRPGPGSAFYPVGAAAPRIVEAIAAWRRPAGVDKRFFDAEGR